MPALDNLLETLARHRGKLAGLSGLSVSGVLWWVVTTRQAEIVDLKKEIAGLNTQVTQLYTWQRDFLLSLYQADRQNRLHEAVRDGISDWNKAPKSLPAQPDPDPGVEHLPPSQAMQMQARAPVPLPPPKLIP